MITRRNFLGGLAVALAAPAIVKAESLMRLRSTPLLMPGEVRFADPMTATEIVYRQAEAYQRMTDIYDRYSDDVARILARAQHAVLSPPDRAWYQLAI